MATINQPSTSTPLTNPRELAPNLKYQRDKDRQMVRGKFIFHEVPGGKMEFAFRAYKGDPIEIYRMTDGEILTIPLGVYKHLNTNVWYPSWNYKSNSAGMPEMTIGQKIRRCSFQSMEFLDIEGDTRPLPSAIEAATPQKA